LKRVRRDFRCSAGFLYTALYRHLELERRKRLYPWPDVIGLDEDFFGRNKRLRTRDFVSMVVDFRGKRLMDWSTATIADSKHPRVHLAARTYASSRST
jgi:hypothetical protein